MTSLRGAFQVVNCTSTSRASLLTSIVVALASAPLSGCGGSDPSWGLERMAATGVDPQLGLYSFSATGCLEVIAESDSGRKIVRFSPDCFRHDSIAIEAGAFFNEHGSINGTNCPTDSYAITGAFTSPTRAEGIIKYAQNCSVNQTTIFVAIRR